MSYLPALLVDLAWVPPDDFTYQAVWVKDGFYLLGLATMLDY